MCIASVTSRGLEQPRITGRVVEISHLFTSVCLKTIYSIQTHLKILNYLGNDPEPFAVVAGLTLRTNAETQTESTSQPIMYVHLLYFLISQKFAIQFVSLFI